LRCPQNDRCQCASSTLASFKYVPDSGYVACNALVKLCISRLALLLSSAVAFQLQLALLDTNHTPARHAGVTAVSRFGSPSRTPGPITTDPSTGEFPAAARAARMIRATLRGLCLRAEKGMMRELSVVRSPV
jgi:hypothetical protein